jgi:hypothetical protein
LDELADVEIERDEVGRVGDLTGAELFPQLVAALVAGDGSSFWCGVMGKILEKGLARGRKGATYSPATSVAAPQATRIPRGFLAAPFIFGHLVTIE